MSAVDNSNIALKVSVRERVAAGHPADAAVLDCYAGGGKMRELAWRGRRVVGIDRKPDLAAVQHVGDCLMIAPRLAASGNFALFDLDAYGNPWPVFERICAAMPAGNYGFAVTCGIRRSLAHHNSWVNRRLGLPRGIGLNLLPFYEQIVATVLRGVEESGTVTALAEWAAPRKIGLTVRYWNIQVCKER